MYCPAKPVERCQCCQQRVTFSNLEGSSNLFGNHNSPQIVHSSDNPCCGARHIRRLSKAFLICRPRPLAQVAPPATGGAPIAPQLLSYIFLLFCWVQSLPCAKGGGCPQGRQRDCLYRHITIPQSAPLTAPFTQGGLSCTLQLFYKLRSIICKRGRLILAGLLFAFTVL